MIELLHSLAEEFPELPISTDCARRVRTEGHIPSAEVTQRILNYVLDQQSNAHDRQTMQARIDAGIYKGLSGSGYQRHKTLRILMALEERGYPIDHIDLFYDQPTWAEMEANGTLRTTISPYELLRNIPFTTAFKFGDHLIRTLPKAHTLGKYNPPSRSHLHRLATEGLNHDVVPHHNLRDQFAEATAAALAAIADQSEHLPTDSSTTRQEYEQAVKSGLAMYAQYPLEQLTAKVREALREPLMYNPPCTITVWEAKKRKEVVEADNFTQENLHDLYRMAVGAYPFPRWSADGLLLISQLSRTPMHNMLLWLMQASLYLRRNLISPKELDRAMQMITNQINVDLVEYQEQFTQPFCAYRKHLIARHYHTLQHLSDLFQSSGIANPTELLDLTFDIGVYAKRVAAGLEDPSGGDYDDEDLDDSVYLPPEQEIAVEGISPLEEADEGFYQGNRVAMPGGA